MRFKKVPVCVRMCQHDVPSSEDRRGHIIREISLRWLQWLCKTHCEHFFLGVCNSRFSVHTMWLCCRIFAISTELYLGGKLNLSDEKLTGCKRLFYLVKYITPSETISRWTNLLIGCCNCAIQDGVQDDCHSFASMLKNNSHNLMLVVTQSNVNRFSKKNFT